MNILLRLLCIGIFATLFLAAGCQWPEEWQLSNSAKPVQQHEESPSAEPEQPNRLMAEIDRLETENEILTSRLESLTARAESLESKLREAQFVNRQQARQIETLADAPKQRDHYKAEAERLSEEVAQLRKLIEQMRSKIGSSETRPASDPSGR